MKKYFLIFLLFSIPSLSFAECQECDRTARADVTMIGGSHPAATSCADSSCSGFLVCQNFEGTGCDNSESWTTGAGTPDPDYTTSPLRGSQSLFCAANTCAAQISYTAQDEIYFFVRFKATGSNSTSDREIMSFDPDDYVLVFLTSEMKLKVTNRNYTGTGTTVLSLNTVYFIWGHVRKSTGGDNGITELWLSTSKTKPGSTEVDSGGGNHVGQMSRIVIGNIFGDFNSIFDQVLVSTSVIGNVCE